MYFSRKLKRDIKYMRENFSDFPNILLPKNMSVKDFNSLFVVPFFNFENLDDYYRKSSAKYVVSDIKVPCKILLSEDDPIISWKSFYDVSLLGNVDVFITKNGGHLGYLGSSKNRRGFYWLNNLLLEWIK